jgi:hypothetical protein
LKGGEINEKDCFDDFIVGFGFGVGRVPLVASPRPSSLQSALRFKMRELLNSPLSFSKFNRYQKKSELSFDAVRLFLTGFLLLILFFRERRP